MSAGINKALAFIRENLTRPFGEADLAPIAGQSTSAFSRAFRRHTGMSLVQYVKRLRINLACQILMSDERASITDICFEVGFNNLSNFNRQFLAEKGMPPSRFRRLLLENINRPMPRRDVAGTKEPWRRHGHTETRQGADDLRDDARDLRSRAFASTETHEIWRRCSTGPDALDNSALAL